MGRSMGARTCAHPLERLAPPSCEQVLLPVHVAGLAAVLLPVLALQLRHEVRVHPALERLRVAPVELEEATLVARIAEEGRVVGHRELPDDLVPHLDRDSFAPGGRGEIALEVTV